jgi:branched-chain amino acid transport system substrate-binding protein
MNALSRGFLETAMTMDPRPRILAIVGADAEYPHVALDGARENAKHLGLRLVYDRTYPPNAVDFAPIIRSIQATNPDVVYVASYPPDSVGIVRAANEIGLKTAMFGGGMIGLQFAPIKTLLGPQLNGIVAYELYVPEPTMNFAGIVDFLKRYQERAAKEGIDPLGLYIPPFAYAGFAKPESRSYCIRRDSSRATSFTPTARSSGSPRINLLNQSQQCCD